MAILPGDHPRESVKERHSALASENVTNSLISQNLETVQDRR